MKIDGENRHFSFKSNGYKDEVGPNIGTIWTGPAYDNNQNLRCELAII